jgi:N-acetylglucosaminyldiphosphoundecaprenol N-acetyl-beta-D-mannosaminyltransferase
LVGVTRIDILGCPFDAISFDETVEAMRNAIGAGVRLQVVPGSIDTVMKSRRNPNFAKDLLKADLVVADGVPIVWSAALLGTPIRGRVSGTELVFSCAAISAETGCGVALIGGAEGVAARAAGQMMTAFPKARLTAVPTPFPITPEENEKLVLRIREADCQIVLAALGAPRQERWITENLERCGANVGIGVGSAFDIISGDKPRAPQWLQNAGMEWFHRMLLEPGRLGRRYLLEDSPFLAHLAWALAKRSVGGRY